MSISINEFYLNLKKLECNLAEFKKTSINRKIKKTIEELEKPYSGQGGIKKGKHWHEAIKDEKGKYYKIYDELEEKYNLLIFNKQLCNVIPKIKRFNQEKKVFLGLKKNSGITLIEKKHCFWKFYYRYLFKEFLFSNYKRISFESNLEFMSFVRRSKDKLSVDMLDKHIYWAIPETNYEDDQKYHQRFISNVAYTALKQIVGEDFDQREHVATYAKELKLEMDHALPKRVITKFVIRLCHDLCKSKSKKEIVEKIDKEINEIVPFMIGVIVTKDENTALRSITITEESYYQIIYKLYNSESLKPSIKILDSDNSFKEYIWSEDSLKVKY